MPEHAVSLGATDGIDVRLRARDRRDGLAVDRADLQRVDEEGGLLVVVVEGRQDHDPAHGDAPHVAVERAGGVLRPAVGGLALGADRADERVLWKAAVDVFGIAVVEHLHGRSGPIGTRPERDLEAAALDLGEERFVGDREALAVAEAERTSALDRVGGGREAIRELRFVGDLRPVELREALALRPGRQLHAGEAFDALEVQHLERTGRDAETVQRRIEVCACVRSEREAERDEEGGGPRKPFHVARVEQRTCLSETVSPDAVLAWRSWRINEPCASERRTVKERTEVGRPRGRWTSRSGGDLGASRQRASHRHDEMRVVFSPSVRRASTQRSSVSPVIRQRASTARFIEARARHGLPQVSSGRSSRPVAALWGAGAARVASALVAFAAPRGRPPPSSVSFARAICS